MEQTDEDLRVLVLSTRDVHLAAAGTAYFADLLMRSVRDRLKEKDQSVEQIGELAAHADELHALAVRLLEEAAD